MREREDHAHVGKWLPRSDSENLRHRAPVQMGRPTRGSSCERPYFYAYEYGPRGSAPDLFPSGARRRAGETTHAVQTL